jgi:photosynthetic reaction center cytochrome c subunit
VNLLIKGSLGLGAALFSAATVAAFKPSQTFQLGHPGAGMEQVETNERLAERVADNALPPSLPAAAQTGALAVDAYKNVRVLGHVSSAEFTRLMTAMTLWVSPNQGCAYCHAPQRDAAGNVVKNDEGYPLADLNNMQSDELYTKVVARRMLQMTMRINADWKPHVKETGVTCYTCHHGNPVPLNIWFDPVEASSEDGALGHKAGQNAPSSIAALSSLPNSSLRPFLGGDATDEIRVLSTDAIGSESRTSIKQTEWTYSLMMHMSKSLGVNCTYCHNTRSMGAWGASPATRTTAWYGIRMVRELNHEYLEPLTSLFPAERLGPAGDGPKVNCATCHAGAFKPLLGVSMLKDYQVLAEAKPQPLKTSAPAVNSAFVGGFGGAGGVQLGGRDAGAGGAPRFEPPGEVEPPKPLPSVLPSASAPAFREAVPPAGPR